MTLGGSPVQLTPLEYRTLVELTANAGRVLTYEHLLKRVWGVEPDADVCPMRTVISTLCRRLGDESDNPTYNFTEPRVGYRMPRRWESTEVEPSAEYQDAVQASDDPLEE